MKILYLHLHNFAHIYSGLGVRDVYLDFYQNNKVINVLIGKMGSCKTVILGHLQPFANFGTIDSRNQDGIVIPGESGMKEIHFRCDNHIYKITHIWNWRSGHHLLKSSILEDGNELNPSGSVTNFKVLVELKLGLDQNMLTLLRLGPNVTNMIDLSAASRKSFMAGLLQDTEIYTMLFKKLNEDYRMMNAKASVLTGQLAKVSRGGNIQEIRMEYESSVDQIRVRTKENEKLQKKINDLEVSARSSTNGMTIHEFSMQMRTLQSERDALEKEIQESETSIQEQLDAYKGKSVSDILVDIGACKQKKESIAGQLLTLDVSYKTSLEEAQSLREKQLIAESKDQIQALQRQYIELQERYEELSQSVATYTYQYDSTMLRRVLTQIHTIDILISDIANYNPDSVKDALRHGPKALAIAKKKTEELMKMQTSLHRQIGNIQFMQHYYPTEVVYFPPECPTEDCPYYRTHPATIAAKQKEQPDTSEIEKIKSKLSDIEKDIGRYSEYPLIVSKIGSLSVVWQDVAPTLRNIHALITNSMQDIFSNLSSQVWYDHDLLIQCIEKSENYESKARLEIQLGELKKQLDALTGADSENLGKALQEAEEKCRTLEAECIRLEEESRRMDEEEKHLNQILDLKMSLDRLHEELQGKKNHLQEMDETLKKKQKSLDLVEALKAKMEPLLQKKSDNEKEIRSLTDRRDQMKLAISEYDATSKDLKQLQEDQEILKYIVEAVSSSKGIPLVYIQLFLKTCKEILNSLLEDVFGDQLEILDFVITQDEFKIPYSINGTVVEDIAKASQGQRSIISLALSFALIRQAMTRYNILLLDEMDGPLYVSDRTKFLDILYKQIAEIGAEQIFLVSHNNTFDGHSVNVIMTTEENVEDNGLVTVMRVCDQGGEEEEGC